MSGRLLPDDFDEVVATAVDMFWHSRGSGVVAKSQGGSRDAVVGGKNMDGFVSLVRMVAVRCGLDADDVHVRKSRVVLPGFSAQPRTGTFWSSTNAACSACSSSSRR